MDTEFFRTLSRNSDERMNDLNSPYAHIYRKDLQYRSRQKKADVKKCAERLVKYAERKRLPARHALCVPVEFRIFPVLPDFVKDFLMAKFM